MNTERVKIEVYRTIQYSDGCREKAIEEAERMAMEGESVTTGIGGEFYSVEFEYTE